MEQEEEKVITKSSRRRNRRQSSPSPSPQVSTLISSLPNDLTSMILLKLNERSLARSRCVSNLWSSITTDPYFVKSFQARSSTSSILLFFTNEDNKLFVFTYPQRQQNSLSYSCEPLDSYKIECPKSFCFTFTDSVNGLLCYSKSSAVTVWNPTTKQFLSLPKLEKSWKNVTVFLGYDPVEGKHKVLCMRGIFCDECRVLTLGSAKKSWKNVKTNYIHLPFAGSDGRCINGVVYYKAHLDHMNKHVIMSFDVRSLEFKPITLPRLSRCDMLIAYEGRLSFVHEDNNRDGIKLWVLENAKWSCKSIPIPFKLDDRSLRTGFKLSGVTDAGEFIYVGTTIFKLFCVLYYDPERNSFRKVTFKGIPADHSRLGSGLGDRRFHALQAFPNHIKNYLSSF